MTRPTEKQLAEALSLCINALQNKTLATSMRHFVVSEAERALAAYRTAQKAEAGAAGEQPSAGKVLGDPRLQELFSAAIYGALTSGYQDVAPAPAGHWLEAWWKRGRADAEHEAKIAEQSRQQGMEQANREVVIHGDRWLITPLPAGDVEVRWLGEYLTEGKRLTPRHQPLRVDQADPRCAGCDIPNGCPEYCRCQPAASSAQEPGWVMVPVEPTDEMKYAGQQNFDGGSRWMRVERIYRAMLAAAPARLAGAAHGEAAAQTTIDARKLGKLWSDICSATPRMSPTAAMVAFARAIEAAHGIGTASTASDEGSA